MHERNRNEVFLEYDMGSSLATPAGPDLYSISSLIQPFFQPLNRRPSKSQNVYRIDAEHAGSIATSGIRILSRRKTKLLTVVQGSLRLEGGKHMEAALLHGGFLARYALESRHDAQRVHECCDRRERCSLVR